MLRLVQIIFHLVNDQGCCLYQKIRRLSEIKKDEDTLHCLEFFKSLRSYLWGQIQCIIKLQFFPLKEAKQTEGVILMKIGRLNLKPTICLLAR